MSIFADNKELGAGINHRITFNGTLTDWDTRSLNISALSNEASTFDERRRISDFFVRIVDLDGAIWTQLGKGTTAFGKGLSVTTTIGGTFGPKSFGQVQGYGQRGTEGGTTYTTHIGSVVEVSKSNRIVTIRSKNNMDRLQDLKFSFPINTNANIMQPSNFKEMNYEDFSFQPMDDNGTRWDSIRNFAGLDISDDRTGCVFYGYPANGTDTVTNSGSGLYDGSVVKTPTSPSNYEWLVKQDEFYRSHSLLKFTGTMLGTYIGTIRDEQTARRYGFPNLGSAEVSKIDLGDDFAYPIGKLRYRWPNGTQQSFEVVYPAAHISMEAGYAEILKYLLTGRFVYRRFSTTDLDSVSFNKSSRLGAFSNFRGTIYTDEKSVIRHIDDVVGITNAMFSVSNDNKFQYLSYGPIELQGTIGTILQKDVISSVINNRKEDAYNRFSLNYRYDKNSNSYGSIIDKQLSSWSLDNDRVLEIESKWMFNDNEANVFMDQLKSRYQNTVPIIEITTPLNKGNIEIGDLVSLTDTNSDISNKIVQVRKYIKDFPNSKTINFECLDGENLYYGRGWAFYTGANVVPATVTGTSTAGFSASGTCPGINNTLYGSFFRYW